MIAGRKLLSVLLQLAWAWMDASESAERAGRFDSPAQSRRDAYLTSVAVVVDVGLVEIERVVAKVRPRQPPTSQRSTSPEMRAFADAVLAELAALDLLDNECDLGPEIIPADEAT